MAASNCLLHQLFGFKWYFLAKARRAVTSAAVRTGFSRNFLKYIPSWCKALEMHLAEAVILQAFRSIPTVTVYWQSACFTSCVSFLLRNCIWPPVRAVGRPCFLRGVCFINRRVIADLFLWRWSAISWHDWPSSCHRVASRISSSVSLCHPAAGIGKRRKKWNCARVSMVRFVSAISSTVVLQEDMLGVTQTNQPGTSS